MRETLRAVTRYQGRTIEHAVWLPQSRILATMPKRILARLGI